MSNLPKLPDLGNFYGDTGGGPNLGLPATDSFPNCPYLDKQQGEFCALDGNLCPFVGFNYRRCKKYLNNMAKAMSQPNMENPVPMGSNQPPRAGTAITPHRHPRLESLTEATKKGGSKNPVRERKKKAKKKRESFYQGHEKAREDELDALLDDPVLKRKMDSWHNTVSQFDPKTSDPDNVAEILGANRSLKDMIDVSQARFGDRDIEKQMDAMADFIATFTKRKLGGRVADGPRGSLKEFSKNVLIAAMLDRDPKNAPQADKASKRAAHKKAQETGDTSAASMTGMDLPDAEPEEGRPTPVTVGSTKKTKYTLKSTSKVGKLTKRFKKLQYSQKSGRRGFTGRPSGSPQFVHAPPEAKAAVEKAEKEAEKKANPPIKRRGMTKAGKMDPVQFANFVDTEIEPLPDKIKEQMFPGVKRGGFSAFLDKMKEAAEQQGTTSNYRQIAHTADRLVAQKEWAENFEQREHRFKQEWDQNLRMLKSVPLADRKAVEMAMKKAKSPKNLGMMAQVMNKLTGRAYKLNVKNVKIGDTQLAMLYREATLPTFTKQNFEVMRMAEQAGLKAIQKQHQYGRGYGRWNTMVTFFKDILIPYLLWRSDNEGYIIPLMTWPSIQKFTDQLYHAFIQSPLPKFKGRSPLQMSRDDKFQGSEKALHPTTGKRLMKGWSRDDLLPPDQAVLHQRWYPTTKKTWGKTRHKELTQRWQQTKAAPVQQDDWMKGYW